MAAPIYPSRFIPGFRLLDGSAVDNAINSRIYSSQYNAVANGTTKATGTQILTTIAHFGTVASGGVAILPAAAAGALVLVLNYGANTLAIYPFDAASTIDGGSANASVNLSAASRGAWFTCVSAGVWVSEIIGATTS